MNTRLALTAAALLALCPTLYAQTPPVAPAAPISPTAPASAPVMLRFGFKPGVSRSYAVVMDATATILTGQSGAGIPMVQHWEMTLRQTVRDVRASDGAATLVTDIDALKIRVNNQDMVLPQGKLDLLKAMTTTTVTPAGETLSTAFSPLLDKMLGGGMTGTAFNPTGLVETVFTLPVGPVTAGDTWRSSQSAAAAAAAPTSIYVLKSLDISGGQPIAMIDRTLDGNLNTIKTSAPLAMKIMSRTTGKGETSFDIQTGTVLHQETNSSAISTIIAKDPRTGAVVSYKMQLQTKIEVGQIFTSVVRTHPTGPLVQ